MSHPADVSGSGSHDYTDTYDPDTDFDAWYTRATAVLIAPYLKPGQTVLELGCATGLMTSLLIPTGVTITGVERSGAYLARAESRRLAGVKYVQAELQNYGTAEQFDHVLATNLLHGFDDPTWLLGRIRGWLAPGGLVHATLPNPDSIHRLAALAEGMIADPLVLSDKAVLYGTRHVWPAAEFRALAAKNGLETVATGGVTLKPYPNEVMARLPGPVLDGLARAAELLPDNGAMHYTVFCHAGDKRATAV